MNKLIAKVKAPKIKSLPNADENYVKIPESLFQGFASIYAVLVARHDEDTIDEALKERMLLVSNSVEHNRYTPFIYYCKKEHGIDLSTYIPSMEESKSKFKSFDPEYLVKIFRQGVDGEEKEDFKIFMYLKDQEIFNRIKTIYIDIGLNLEKDLLMSQPFNPENYGADSLDLVELVMALEDEFMINFSDYVAESLIKACREYELTFKQVIAVLQRLPVASR